LAATKQADESESVEDTFLEETMNRAIPKLKTARIATAIITSTNENPVLLRLPLEEDNGNPARSKAAPNDRIIPQNPSRIDMSKALAETQQ
jgi:hypothetical protein